MSFNVLFLGRVFPFKKEYDLYIKNNIVSNMQDAADLFQKNIINGLSNCFDNIDVLSLLPINSWPKNYKKAYIKSYTSKEKGIVIKIIKSCNITILKQFINSFYVYAFLEKWLMENHSDILIFCYTCNIQFMKAIYHLKAKYKKGKIVVVQIVADIPEYAENDDGHGIKEIFRNLTISKLEKLKSAIDGYVLLTKYMAQKLNILKPYIVIEGIAGKRCSMPFHFSFQKKTILYSGSMNIKYGILDLLQSFHNLNRDDVNLILCGTGNAEKEILKYQSIDKRIVFLGKIEHEKVMFLQENCTLLVNPRKGTEEFTKYSFPSKILEYLSSGRPMLAYKLLGIPDEYYSYFFSPKDYSLKELTNSMNYILNLDETFLAKFGDNGKEFVNNNKNIENQTKKIAIFASGILDRACNYEK